MISVPTIACLLCILVILAAAVAVFGIGKLNFLVALRGRISNEVLHMDFSLRKQAEELRSFAIALPQNEDGFFPGKAMSALDRAERIAHMAAAGRLSEGNIARLADAERLIASCWKVVMKDGGEDMARLALHRLESNAKAWGNISGMLAHYAHHAGKFPCCWVARASGFERADAKEPLKNL